MVVKRLLGALGICVGMTGAIAMGAEPDVLFNTPTLESLPLSNQTQPPPTTAPRPPLSQQPTTPPQVRPTTPATTQPAGPVIRPPALETAPVTDVFAQAPVGGTTSTTYFNPNMIGDLLAGSYARTNVPVTIPVPILIPIPGTNGRSNTGVPLPPPPPITVLVDRTIQLPIALQPIVTRGSFKISDNESPRPMDRFFATYNYYYNGSLPTGPVNRTFDLHRETFGFEKTLLGSDVSVGLRLNVIQTTGAINDSDFGDTTIVTKYALVNNPDTGNVLSGGLAVTAPTGPRTILFNGQTVRSTLLQPWLGSIVNLTDRLFAHGFSSLIIPTDADDVLLASTDFGVGWNAYRAANCQDAIVSFVTPTVEGHWTASLTNSGFDAFRALSFPEDVFVITNGVHVGLGCRSILTLGLAVPLSGPRPFDLETVAQLNFRY